jgi:hypothetical protein
MNRETQPGHEMHPVFVFISMSKLPQNGNDGVDEEVGR